MADHRSTAGATRRGGRTDAGGLQGYQDAREAVRLRSVQEPLTRVRAALDEATGAATDPATRALVQAVALLADVVESIASPLPAEE